MKRFVAILLTVLLALGMVACAAPQTPAEPAAAPTEPPAATAGPAADEADAPEGGVQTVIYAFPGTAARLNYINDDGSYAGYEIDIVRELDARLPEYTFELYCAAEFSALTPGLDAGKFDMVGSNITWKKERAENYLYSKVPYIHTPYAMAVRPDETQINGLEDLGGRKMVCIPGTAGTLFLEQYNEQHPDNPIQLEYIESNAIDNVAMLVDGRVDATFGNVSDYAIAEEERGYKVKIINIDNPDLVQQPDGYFLFPKGAEELQQKVDECLIEMREDGTLSKLCLQYFTMDFSQLPEGYTPSFE